MGRLLAIDYGTKRVGVAVSDPLKIIASPLDVTHSKDIIQFLKDYTATEDVEAFIVGMPKKLDNTDTNNTVHVNNFINLLKKKFPDTKIITHDERFTSKIAMQAMIAGGAKKKDRRNKGNVDKVSAAVILQSYMESSPGF